jgi:hypothetical protein
MTSKTQTVGKPMRTEAGEASFEPVMDVDIETWAPQLAAAMSERFATALEEGKVLCLSRLPFPLSGAEQAFLSPVWLSGKRKNISLDGEQVSGASGVPEALASIGSMIKRYSDLATELITRLFPGYRNNLKQARTSFRPGLVDDAPASWRKDDSRLHVDAFPSRPNHGDRILRVFTNVNNQGIARVWRIGEPFAAAARHFLPAIPRPVPGSARLLHALKITRSSRSEYDHIMLQLHDRMKADLDYQASSPQREVRFQPGTTWICFSDQVLHAAMSGQFMFEQTMHLPVSAQYHPDLSPLSTLEKLKGRALIPRPG